MGLAAGVLSVADEPDIDASFLLQSLKNEMDLVMKRYPPDGDCHEGAGYQSFGCLPIAAATLMMDRVLGTTYQKTSGIKNAAAQQLYLWGPGRNSDLSWEQLQFTVNAAAARSACLLDPWKKPPTVNLTNSGGTVTLTVRTATWTWQDTKDATTPPNIQGVRGGVPLIALTAADKAPKE